MATDSWDLSAMPDQTGRTVVVTGANSGLGLAATRALADAGAEVIMACRDLERGRQAREDVTETVEDVAETVDDSALSVRDLDLADLASVRSFAETVAEEFGAIDVLCNNAGVMAIPRSETADGFETQIGVNHLGHFALTGHLLDALRASEGEARVVTQSSGLHENGEIDFDDLQGTEDYDPWDAYAQSKLANVLFAYELDRRLRAADASIASLACHPGYAATNLQERGPRERGSTLRLWAMQLANAVFAQSPKRGALAILYAATAPEADGGEYVGPGGLMNMRGHPERQRSSDLSYDPDLARRLWEVSADLTGVAYDLPEA